MLTYLWIAVAGAFGAVARYAFGEHVVGRLASGFPLGTLLINVAGSFLLGLMTGTAGMAGWPAGRRLAVTVGFLGAFTTFSTFSVDTVQLWSDGRTGLAVTNVVVSVAAGLCGAWAGLRLAGWKLS